MRQGQCANWVIHTPHFRVGAPRNGVALYRTVLIIILSAHRLGVVVCASARGVESGRGMIYRIFTAITVHGYRHERLRNSGGRRGGTGDTCGRGKSARRVCPRRFRGNQLFGLSRAEDGM